MASNESIETQSIQIKSEASSNVAIDIFNEYSNQELEDLIEQTIAEFSSIDTENQIFLSFIANEDPVVHAQIMTGFGKLPQDIHELTALDASFETLSWLDGGSSLGESIYSRKSKRSLSTFTRGSQKSIVTGTTETSGYHKTRREQLSPLMKNEMAEKEIKRKEENIKEIIRSGEQQLEQISSKKIELEQNSNEIKQKLIEFQKQIVTDGVDPITGRIPAEIFLKFIRAKVKQDNTLTDKLRLRTASYKQTAKTIQKKLVTKRQLGGILRPIDFEQLKIDKTQLSKSLKEKDSHFYGLKQVNGQISLACAEQKKALDEKLKLVENLKTKAEAIKQSIQRMKQEHEGVAHKIVDIQKDIEKLGNKMKHYRTPSVDDYCNKKEVLRELEKRNKILEREYELLLSKLNSKIVIKRNKN